MLRACLVFLPLFALSQVYDVGFLVVNGVYNTELTAPYDILEHSRYRDPNRYFRCFLVSPDSGHVKTAEGLVLQVDYSFETCPKLDVLVVPSAENSMGSDLENAGLMAWVRKRIEEAQIVISLCDGAFVLAESGALDGMNVTTFPADQDELQKRYPTLSVHKSVSLVQDGKFITSVGGAKSFDPALFLTEKWFSAEIAKRTAQGLVIDWDRKTLSHFEGQSLPGPQ